MRSVLLRVLFCVFMAGATLYAFIERQNRMTKMRLEIPILEKEVRMFKEESRRLKYEIEMFENPVHLIELLQKPEFGHLKHPHIDEVTIIDESR